MAKGWKMTWRGDDVIVKTVNVLGEALTEIGLEVEGEGKKELQKGHGVITGTLRRSIHTAAPGYDWGGDNVKPSESSPDRGNVAAVPANRANRLSLEVGSGMEYALPVHQGHGSFPGYHFLTNAIEKVRSKVPGILRKHGAALKKK